MRASNVPAPARAANSAIFLIILVVPFIAFCIALAGPSQLGSVFGIGAWYDPLFFQYNVLLWSLFVLLIPFVTYFYVHSMREEREARLKSELRETWDQHEKYMHAVISRQFSMGNYLGSTFVLMIVVAMGLVVLFLVKPVPMAGGHGLDYSKGANLFLMGAYIGLPTGGEPNLYFDRVITSLTAFQFGFLGAYTYFIGHLVRSYFTMDLTPNTFVAMSIRMVTAGLVALVVSFALADLPRFFGADHSLDEAKFRALLPVVSFGIGFFPDWGLLAIQKLTRRALLLGREERAASTSLTELSGMSYEHEVRLKRQGYDSVENVAEANLVEMAVRTGFSYGQLRTWAGEAWLRVRLGRDDYRKFVDMTGIRTADQFRAVFGDSQVDADGAAKAALAAAQGSLRIKIECIARLARDWQSFQPPDASLPLPIRLA